MIQETVRRIFNTTSDWQSFDVAHKKNQEIWTQNQYPTECSSSVVNETFLKTVKSLSKNELKPMCFVQYRGNIAPYVVSRLKKLCDIQIIFTRKVRTFLPTQKSSLDKNLKSHVLYKVTCNGCSSIYVGQTSRHVTTRISEHQKKDSPVGQHLVECGGTAHIEWDILDECPGVEKLMAIEAIYIKKLKPQLNTRDEYRGRELTLVQIEKF